jgi:HEAT repeat protein
MRVIPGGKPGEPDPIGRRLKPSDDGLDDLFADLSPRRDGEPLREPSPGMGWDVLPASSGSPSSELPVLEPFEDPAVAEDDTLGAARAQLEPAVKAAGVWLQMFARTLKTSRLYDAGNPAAVRFREELARALRQLLTEHGAVTYRFTADDVSCDGHSLYAARSREDNLAFPFFRDGVRGITITPGAEPRECDALVDAVLGVTGQNLDGDDLVTLLWEANLRHVDVDYIPAEGETGTGDATAQPEDGALLPWPTAGGGEQEKSVNEPSSGPERAEDWSLGQLTEEVEATFAELDFMSQQEVPRFVQEFEAERRVPPASAALAVADACLNADPNEDDRKEIARFLPRVLRAAIAAGAWADARAAVHVVRACGSGEWSDERFTQELLQPVSITRAAEMLDTQGPAALSEFVALASELGPVAVDWLTLTLSECQTRMARQMVAEAIAVRAQEDPSRLAPWINDPRWYVVRNVVHILGWVGGAGVVPLLQNAVKYPDPRVTAEVVTALQVVEPRLARPVLIRALEGADTRLFCQVLQQLSAARDPAVARYVAAFISQERFLQRPVEERRAIYAAIASTGGDEIVAELEQAMNGGNWFDREQEVHRHAIARCLARIGTPKATAALEAGAQSRRAPVRQACEAALQTRKAA